MRGEGAVPCLFPCTGGGELSFTVSVFSSVYMFWAGLIVFLSIMSEARPVLNLPDIFRAELVLDVKKGYWNAIEGDGLGLC